MKAKELRDLSIEELELKQTEFRKEIYALLNEFKMSKNSEGAHRIPQLRRDIARILTVLNEKKRAQVSAA